MAYELPEAIVVADQMDRELRGKTIQNVLVHPDCASLIRQGFINLPDWNLAGFIVEKVTANGKWIYTWLTNGVVFLIALETGGTVRYATNRATLPEKFNIRLEFTDASLLSIRITGWGFAKAECAADLESTIYPGRLGVSPLDKQEFTPSQFSNLVTAAKNQLLKALLTNQRLIAGISNGYAQEILYQAGIHPGRKAISLSSAEQDALYQAIRIVIAEAVRLGGSELETDLYGHPGGYRRRVAGNRLGQPCPRCGALIEKVSVSGGSMYCCPGCQK